MLRLVFITALLMTTSLQANVQCEKIFATNKFKAQMQSWWGKTKIGKKQHLKKIQQQKNQDEYAVNLAFTNFTNTLIKLSDHYTKNAHTMVEVKASEFQNYDLLVKNWNENKYVNERPITNSSFKIQNYFIKMISSIEYLMTKSLRPLNLEQQSLFLSYFLRYSKKPESVSREKHQYELTIDRDFKLIRPQYWFVLEQYIEAYALSKLNQIPSQKALEFIIRRNNEDSPEANQAKEYIRQWARNYPDMTKESLLKVESELRNRKYRLQNQFKSATVGPAILDLYGKPYNLEQPRIDQLTYSIARLRILIDHIENGNL